MTNNEGGAGTRDAVDFWFDPLCGWSWQASRWMTEVSKLRPVDITWHPFGLAVQSSGEEEVPPDLLRKHELAKRYARVAAAVQERCGADAVGPFYTALGGRIHATDGQFAPVLAATEDTVDEARVAALNEAGPVIAAALAECELPADLLSAMDSAEWDVWLRTMHQQVPSGKHKQQLMGVPMMSVNGSAALFGPVIGESPRGERAARLWDAFRVLAAEESFFELKRAIVRPHLRDYIDG